jgi:hypothetical protein
MIHTRTNALHYTGNFVARNDRKANKWEIPILDHEIAMTDAAGTNANQYFTMAWYRYGAVLKLEFPFCSS